MSRIWNRLRRGVVGHGRLSAWLPFGMLAVGLAFLALAWLMVGGCGGVHAGLSLAVTPDVLQHFIPRCDITTSKLRWSLLANSFGALLYGPAAAMLLARYWRRGWRAGAERGTNVVRAMVAVPLAAASCDVVENTAGMVFARVRAGQLEISIWGARISSAIGSLKWILTTASVLLVGLTLYGMARFRRIAIEPDAGPTPPLISVDRHDRRVGRVVHPATSICLSGGGIRSAAFSWGALAALRRDDTFMRLRRMYSVSGGGYAATAWSAASDELREMDNFFQIEPGPEGIPPPTVNDRYEYVRENRCYLDNRRGGLGRALLLAVLTMVMNVFVIVLGLIVVFVPIGLVAASGLGAVNLGNEQPSGVAGAVHPGVWWPSILILCPAGLAVAVSMFTGPRIRRACLGAAGVFVAAAVLVGVIWIGLPWAAVATKGLVRSLRLTTVPAIVIWLASSMLAVIKPRLRKAAARLGGVLSTGAMFGVGLRLINVVGRRADSGETLAFPRPVWMLVVVGAGAALTAIDILGIQWWSLHPLYRDRLADTFLMTRGRVTTSSWKRLVRSLPVPWKEEVPARTGHEIAAQDQSEWRTWPELSAHRATHERDRPTEPYGPEHVVCAATHRLDDQVTGLRVASFTFSAAGVAMHVPEIDEDVVTVTTYRRDAAWFDQVVGHGERKLIGGKKQSSIIAAAAISGAAFNSAMGRHSKGSTDSLLAVLNLRLGVWIPNPRFSSVHDKGRYTRPGLRYLFNEVVGRYDLTDPFVHVSDGGHWENLGLVEALRDCNQQIICVDASGGEVASSGAERSTVGFETLFEAIDLARIELHTEVAFPDGAIDAMRPNARTGRCAQNWATATITYHIDSIHDWRFCSVDDCPQGSLLYVKALVSDRTPENVLAFANTDRVFPDYPTGDQFLSDEQFRALAGLGESAMHEALRSSSFMVPSRGSAGSSRG